MSEKKITKLRKTYKSKGTVTVLEFIAGNCTLTEAQIKSAIELGGLWLKRSGKKKIDRFSNPKHQLKSGDYIEFNYDPSLKIGKIDGAVELRKEKGYGVWFKPAGMMVQGNQFADAGSLLRVAGKKKSGAFFVHPLDKNAKGLVLIAYTKEMATKLTRMMQEHSIVKFYRALVLGCPQSFGVIETPIDGKEAITTYSLVERREGRAVVEVELETERLLQIRRHLDEIGHPIIGDNKYGKGNKDPRGLQLVAHRIELLELDRAFDLPEELASL